MARGDRRGALALMRTNGRFRQLAVGLLVSRIGDNDIASNVMLLLPLADCDGRIEMLLVGSFYNEHFKRGTHIHDMAAREIQLG